MLNKRWLISLTVLCLLILIVIPACGDENDEEGSPALTATQVVTGTSGPTTNMKPTATPGPTTSQGPVKIGAITSWSGPTAMSGLFYADRNIKLVEWQVKQAGGILGGREVKFVKYDDRSSVAESVAGANKLTYDDQVSVLTLSGAGGAEQDALGDFAEQNKILYVAFGDITGMAQRHYAVSATVSAEGYAKTMVDAINKLLKPATVAFLGTDSMEVRQRIQLYKAGTEPVGIKTVYEQYGQPGTTDYSPFLSKIKYEQPDLLVIDSGSTEMMVTIAKQIMELGGWGKTKVLSFPPGEGAKTMPGAQGWYVLAMWVPGLEYPGSVSFEKDFQTVNGQMPSPNDVYFYNSLWTAIKAIELAGVDDPVKVAEAARSGKLEWDTPIGRAHYTLENGGYSGLSPLVTRVEEGKLVLISIPE